MARYAVGLDYGTNSVRAVVVNVANGREIGTAVWGYEHGHEGVILSKDPNLARQHPADYVRGAEVTIRRALSDARRSVRSFKPADVIGIGVDTTGSTPLPVDADGRPLAMSKAFAREPAAMAWLWKDHTSVAEAEEITALAARLRPQYLAKCGGTYSSEWFFSKILHCLRTAPKVFDAACTWVEIADWIPAMLTGTEHPDRYTAGVCAAGHKAMYNDDWGGYPDARFLSRLDPKMGLLRTRLKARAHSIDTAAGPLTAAWAKKTHLPAGIPVAVGAFDAHLGGVGAGIKEGTLVKIIGTSTCDMMVVRNTRKLADVPGLCGIVNGSILPGYFGLEAGQSAVGDIFNWFVNYLQPGGKSAGSHEALTKAAGRLAPGESGLLALDWNNGNRTPHGPAAGPDFVHHAGGDLPRVDRGHRFRGADDHQPLRGVRGEGPPGGQLRRDRREEPAGDADLRGRDRKAHEGVALTADVRGRRRHGRGGGRREKGGRVQRLRRRPEGHDRPEGQGLQARPRRPARVREALLPLPPAPRRLRHRRMGGVHAQRHERPPRYPHRRPEVGLRSGGGAANDASTDTCSPLQVPRRGVRLLGALPAHAPTSPRPHLPQAPFPPGVFTKTRNVNTPQTM
jgi:ribulokinase